MNENEVQDFERQGKRLSTRIDEYNVQKRGHVSTHFGTTCNEKKDSSHSKSDLVAMCFALRVMTGPVISSLDSLDTNMAAHWSKREDGTPVFTSARALSQSRPARRHFTLSSLRAVPCSFLSQTLSIAFV